MWTSMSSCKLRVLERFVIEIYLDLERGQGNRLAVHNPRFQGLTPLYLGRECSRSKMCNPLQPWRFRVAQKCRFCFLWHTHTFFYEWLQQPAFFFFFPLVKSYYKHKLHKMMAKCIRSWFQMPFYTLRVFQ